MVLLHCSSCFDVVCPQPGRLRRCLCGRSGGKLLGDGKTVVVYGPVELVDLELNGTVQARRAEIGPFLKRVNGPRSAQDARTALPMGQEALDLTPNERGVLEGYLRLLSPTQVQVASEVGLSQGTVSRIVSGLVELGLLVREEGTFRLTERGRSLVGPAGRSEST